MPKQVKKNVKKATKKSVKKTSTQTTKKTVTSKKPQVKKTTKTVSKAVVPVTAPVVAPVVAPQKTVAEKIWENIKDKTIDMFALPGQTPAKYCKPVTVEPHKLYLKFTVSAVLPALEEAFKSIYNVELVDKYIVMTIKPEVAKK